VVNVPNAAVLTGAFRPMRFEATVEDSVTTFGEIPKDLAGGFYRVGPAGRQRSAVDVPVSRWTENLGEYVIFDTDDITAGPICRIEIPCLLGFTPHGHWMDSR
jgi:carotenoid cleavage dioxygenase-like enzyme